MDENYYDLIIIGVGPAGLSAAIYSARMGLKTLVLGESLGLAAEATIIENYPGFRRISGLELVEKMREQAEEFGAVIHLPETVVDLDLKGKIKSVKTEASTYKCGAIIIATGCIHRKLNIPGEEEFKGKGVSYCVTCDGPFFKGKKVAVVGGGNAAATAALYLKDLASNVFLIHRREDLRADEILKRRVIDSGVSILFNSEVKAIVGRNFVEKVVVFNKKTGEENLLEIDGVFIYVGEEPQSGLAKKAGVLVDDEGFIIVNRRQETNIEGVYAAGDVTGNVRQIGTAVGEGITAAVNSYLYLRGGWYGKEKVGV